MSKCAKFYGSSNNFFIVLDWNEFVVGVTIYRNYCQLHLGFLTFVASWGKREVK